jgi:NDP-sugar pyrophosphorylase family protein
MRAMIVAAGLGTRLRPLSELCPKPALPVRGIPLIAYTLALLARHGVTEVVINVHHLPEIMMEAARRYCPASIELRFSMEKEILDTGGGIARVADFLRESDPCLILGADMLFDADLSALIGAHKARGDAFTMLLRSGDERAEQFGTIGANQANQLCRIGNRFDLGGEGQAGVYTWANVVAPRAFDSLPKREIFSHLDDWLAPQVAAGAQDIRCEVVPSQNFIWEPVGTPSEYLAANLDLPQLSYADAVSEAQRSGARVEGDVVIGTGAVIGSRAKLQRVVVWEGERVEEGLQAQDGVFAGGRFHPCGALQKSDSVDRGAGRR